MDKRLLTILRCPLTHKGLVPVGRRNSTIRFSANSDRFEPDIRSCSQSNPLVATYRSRSVKSRSRAARRIASVASATSRCSSPLTR